MKVFGTDISKKYFGYKSGGVKTLVSFDYRLWTGITNIEVSEAPDTSACTRDKEIEVTSAYPGFIRLSQEVALIVLRGIKRIWHKRSR